MKTKSVYYWWIILLLIWISRYVSAQSVSEISVKLEEPGTLGKLIGDKWSEIEYLKISGDMNGNDLATIGNFHKLISLDLKDANIKYGGYNYSSTLDDEFPSFVMYMYKNLSSVVLPNSLKVVSFSAFWGHDALKSVVMGNNVKIIRSNAFELCRNLVSINLSEQLEYIGSYVFRGCMNLKSIRIPASVNKIDGSPSQRPFEECYSLSEIEVDTHNSRYASENGFLYTINRDSILDYTYGNPRETIYIPSSVTYVVEGVIHDAHHVKQVYVNNMTPPEYIKDGSLDKTLYVPKGAYKAYFFAKGWCNFKNIVESDLLTANESIVEANAFDLRQAEKGIAIRVERPMQLAIYATDGQLMLHKQIESEETIALPQGLYVVKAGGQTAKVRVK